MAKQKAERRSHKRMDMDCLIEILRNQAGRPIRGRTVNLSDGGAMVSVPIQSIPDLGEKVDVTISLPRSTPNSRMIETVSSSAKVVRHEPGVDDAVGFIAVQFPRPMDLDLEV